MILAPGGTRTAPRAPTAVMVASSMRTTPSGITATSGDGITRPPTSAVTRPPAAVAAGGAVPHTAGRSEERRVGKSVDLGGRRSIKKKNRHTDGGRRHGTTNKSSDTEQPRPAPR